MNTKLQACFDAINNLEPEKLTDEELQMYYNFVYDEYLAIGDELYKRKLLCED